MTIRTKKWKLYKRLNNTRLFNLESVPLEPNAVRRRNKKICKKLKKKLNYILGHGKDVAESEKVDLGRETSERLRSLGYVE